MITCRVLFSPLLFLVSLLYGSYDYFGRCSDDSFPTKINLPIRTALISLKAVTCNVTLIGATAVPESFEAVESKLCNLHFVGLPRGVA